MKSPSTTLGLHSRNELAMLIPPQAPAPRSGPGSPYVVDHSLGFWHFGERLLHLNVAVQAGLERCLLAVSCRRYLVPHPKADKVQILVDPVHIRLELLVRL